MEKNDTIVIAGANGMVGSALVRYLEKENYQNVIKLTRKEADLTKYDEVDRFFKMISFKNRNIHVFDAAAKVGGIFANNKYPAEFISNNLIIQYNIINICYKYNITKLVFLGSSCIYPRNCPQPMKEEYLLTSQLEPTNEAYAIAKITGIKMCEAYNKQYGCNFVSAMPTNLYGPNDNFNLQNSHVLPAMIHKFHLAKINGHKFIELWGSGYPYREFMHVDDAANALVDVMKDFNNSSIINIGTGVDISIRDLANIIREIVDFNGDITWNINKPDGMPKKLLNIDKLRKLGYYHSYSLVSGIRNTYEWFCNNYPDVKGIC